MFQRLVLLAVVCAAPAFSQFDFKVDGRDVQIHSFGSQGFMYSNQNNYMSAPTRQGTFALTDGGANISTNITDKFRVGAQIYDRNIGDFGNWRPVLDWAYGAYKFTSWFGIRAGRVKTTLGLYNDIQDNDSLNTFALLPEGMYPVDWRATTISHDGGDVFGSVNIKHLGTFSYTGYAGMRPQDKTSGYIIAAQAVGVNYSSLGGPQVGGDVRWTMPFGAVIGMSYLKEDITGIGNYTAAHLAYHQDTNTDGTVQYYGQYILKGFRIETEYRRNVRDVSLYFSATPLDSAVDSRTWYIAGAYRVAKHLELGSYRSVYYVNTRISTAPPLQHLFDTVVTARFDLTNHLYLKAEGHFIDGDPTTPSAARGFYAVDNPNGILPATNMFVLRSGVSF